MLAVVSLSILLTWSACAVVLVGIGSLILGCMVENWFFIDAFWVGLAGVVAFLQIYHLVWPVDGVIELALALLGILGIFRNERMLTQKVRESWRNGYWAVASFLLIVSAIAIRSSGPCEHYDTGFYGASAVQWNNAYPVAPGLGNLMAELGQDSSVFLCFAALNHGIWRGLAFHLFDGLLLSALFAAIVPACFRLFRNKAVAPADWFAALLIVPSVFWATNGDIVGTNTDLPATIVCLAGALCLLRVLQPQSIEPYSSNNLIGSLLTAGMLFSLAVTFKLSTAVFAFLGWIIAFVCVWSQSSKGARRKVLIGGALGLSAAIVLPWILGNLVLTGYPLYPSSALGIPVDWKVPANYVLQHAAAVRSWARIPHASLSETQGFQWVGVWFHSHSRNREGFLIPLLFSLGGITAIAYSRIRMRRSVPQRGAILLLPAVSGLVFWFFTAPALRFGEASIWTTAATLGALGATSLFAEPQFQFRRLILALVLMLTILAIYPRTLWRVFYRPAFSIHGFVRLPQAPLVSIKTTSGLAVYVPAEGNQCWDAPLPCSPYFRPGLHLRHPGSLRSGFAAAAAPEELVPLPNPPPR